MFMHFSIIPLIYFLYHYNQFLISLQLNLYNLIFIHIIPNFFKFILNPKHLFEFYLFIHIINLIFQIYFIIECNLFNFH
jgi:hypothetical protein